MLRKFFVELAVTLVFMFANINFNLDENFSSDLNKVYAYSNSELASKKVDEGNQLYNQKKYQDAILKYTEAIQFDNTYSVAYNNRGVVYADLGNYEQAISDFTQAIQLNPNYEWSYNNRGHAYNALAKFNKAISDFNKAIQLNPNYEDAYANRGYSYYILGNYRQAISDCTKAIQLNPKDAGTYYNRGNAYKALGEIEKAEADFAKTRELGLYILNSKEAALLDFGENDVKTTETTKNENNSITYYKYLMEDYLGGKFSNLEDEIAYQTELIKVNETKEQVTSVVVKLAHAYYARGTAYYRLKNYSQAAIDLKKSIEIYEYSNTDSKCNNFGLALIELQNYSEAIKNFTQAILYNPYGSEEYSTFIEGFNNRGIAYAELKNYEQAIKDFSKAIGIAIVKQYDRTKVKSHRKKLAEIYHNRGVCYSQMGESIKAQEDFAKANEIQNNK